MIAKSILSATSGYIAEAGFTHSLTPARNCTFGCTYCYVPTLGIYGGLKPEDWQRWGQFTTFKTNAPDLLRRALRDSQRIYCSPLVDPYQPAEAEVQMMPRILDELMAHPPRRPSLPAEVPYRTVLHALRGHPSLEAEQVLLLASSDWDPTYRAAAFGSVGWWEPILVKQIRTSLRAGRRDPNPVVRQAARAAAARAPHARVRNMGLAALNCNCGSSAMVSVLMGSGRSAA